MQKEFHLCFKLKKLHLMNILEENHYQKKNQKSQSKFNKKNFLKILKKLFYHKFLTLNQKINNIKIKFKRLMIFKAQLIKNMAKFMK